MLCLATADKARYYQKMKYGWGENIIWSGFIKIYLKCSTFVIKF